MPNKKGPDFSGPLGAVLPLNGLAGYGNGNKRPPICHSDTDDKRLRGQFSGPCCLFLICEGTS